MRWLGLLAVAHALTISAAAQYPRLGAVLPRGAQRGTEFELTLRGDHLATAREVVFARPVREPFLGLGSPDGKKLVG